MKKVYIIFLFLGMIIMAQKPAYAQTTLGFSQQGLIGFPDTIHLNDSVQFSAFLVNKSPTSFSGQVSVLMAVNYDSIITLKSFVSVNLNAGDSTKFNFKFHAKGTAFRDGGINIVVVWPEANGAKSDSTKKNFYLGFPLGFNQPHTPQTQFALYPNPVINQLYLKPVSQNFRVHGIRIYNILGIEVLRSLSMPVSMRDLPAGLYLVEIRGENGEQVIRKIKKSE